MATRELPSSGTIRLSEVKTEFEKGNNLLDYLGEGGVTDSPPLKLTDFYGTSAELDPIFGDTTQVISGAGRHETYTGLGGGESFARDMNSNWWWGAEYRYGKRSMVRQFLPHMIDCRPESPYSGQRYTLRLNYSMKQTSILSTEAQRNPRGNYRFGYYKADTDTPLTGYNADSHKVTDQGLIRSYSGSLYNEVNDAVGARLPSDGFAQMYIECRAGYDNANNGYQGITMSINKATWELDDLGRALERLRDYLNTKREDRS